MTTTKVAIGTGRTGKTLYVWMDGTPTEIKEKLSNRFRVYTTRPTGTEAKVAKPTTTRTKNTAFTKPVETPTTEETVTD